MNDEEIKKLIEETSSRDKEYIKDRFDEASLKNQENTVKLVEVSELKIQKNIAEKRLKYALSLVSFITIVLGVIVPLTWTYFNTQSKNAEFTQMKSDNNKIIDDIKKDFADMKNEVKDSKEKNENQREQITAKIDNRLSQEENKVDAKLKDFDNKFDEITNRALRKPKLICLYEGKEIPNQIAVLKTNKMSQSYKIGITLKNIGDAIAENIKIFISFNENISISLSEMFEQKELKNSTYKTVIKYSYDKSIDPKQEEVIDFTIFEEKYSKVMCLFTVYYGEPEPLEYQFEILLPKETEK